MVAGLPRTLASLPAVLGLRHPGVGAAAALLLSVLAAAVAARAVLAPFSNGDEGDEK